MITKEAGSSKHFGLLKTTGQIFGMQSRYLEDIIIHGFFSHLKNLEDYERKN